MGSIPEMVYRNGAVKILKNAGWSIQKINRSIFLAEKSGKKIIYRNCGKNLPYSVGFPWETWIKSDDLKKLDDLSIEHNTTGAYIVYSYAILEADFDKYFDQIEKVEYWKIGCKAISTQKFKENCQPRGHWGIDLPRKSLPDLLFDVSSI